MATRGKIRWTRNDARKVANLARQFNAKITRIIKKNPSIASALPERVNSQAIQQMYSQLTRADFNRWVNSTMRFLKRGAEEILSTKAGVITTRWQLNEIRYNLQHINAERRTRMKALQPSTAKGTMGAIKELELQPRRNLAQHIPVQYWEKYVRGVEKQVLSSYKSERAERYKLNYLMAMRDALGTQPELESIITKIPAETLAEAYAQDPEFSIDYLYYENEIEEAVQNLKEKWSRFLT